MRILKNQPSPSGSLFTSSGVSVQILVHLDNLADKRCIDLARRLYRFDNNRVVALG